MYGIFMENQMQGCANSCQLASLRDIALRLSKFFPSRATYNKSSGLDKFLGDAPPPPGCDPSSKTLKGKPGTKYIGPLERKNLDI